MSKDDAETCANCQWGRKQRWMAPDRTFAETPDSPVAYCHRFPPDSHGRRSKVQPDDWCGEFTAIRKGG